jgi:hypothetical protein
LSSRGQSQANKLQRYFQPGKAASQTEGYGL